MPTVGPHLPRGAAAFAPRALACLLGLLAALLLAAPSAHARMPASFFGMQTWAFNPSASEFDAMGAARVGIYRINFLWAGVEPTPGQRIWVEYDQIAAKAAHAGVRMLPVLCSSPPWAAKVVQYPPSRATTGAWLAFVHDAIARYGRGGSFWRAHPDVPYRPVTSWQVWNEPNFPAYWFKHPNARQYARFLKTTARTIRSTDRRARVVLAGLPQSSHGVPIARFLSAIYRVRGARNAFDVVAIHPYARGPRGVAALVARTRRIMRRFHDRRTPLWITEMGWSTHSPKRLAYATTARGQASRLRRTFRLLIRRRHRYHLGLIAWFSLRDRDLFAGEKDWWAPFTGLFSAAGTPKPAWRAFVRVTGGRATSALAARVAP